MTNHQCSDKKIRKQLEYFQSAFDHISLENNGDLVITDFECRHTLQYHFNFCPFCGEKFERENNESNQNTV